MCLKFCLTINSTPSRLQHSRSLLLEALLGDIILRNWPPLDEPLEIVAWSGDQQRALIDKHHVQPHTLASRASGYIHLDPQGQQCLEMKETMTS